MIIRRIGMHEIAVAPSQASEIWLQPETLALLSGYNPDVPLEKRDILRALSLGNEYVPLTLHWEILDRCNFRCPFCYIVGHSNEKLVRLNEIASHIEALIDHGVLFCTLTGGEVTIHPDFQAIYTLLKERGVVVEHSLTALRSRMLSLICGRGSLRARWKSRYTLWTRTV